VPFSVWQAVSARESPLDRIHIETRQIRREVEIRLEGIEADPEAIRVEPDEQERIDEGRTAPVITIQWHLG
jgi:hypothetical protein